MSQEKNGTPETEFSGTILDVRTQAEFRMASAPGTINIPLQEVPNRLEEIRSMNAPLLLCCASGNRSGFAEQFLGAQGIPCENIGSWLDVEYYLKQLESESC